MKASQRRILILILFVGSLWILLVVRALQLQVLPNEKLAKVQSKQSHTAITLSPRRGFILDRNGVELAASVTAYSVFADPKWIENPQQTAKKLAYYLGGSWKKLQKKLIKKNTRFVWVKRRISPDLKKKIEALELKGIAFVEESKRVYPNMESLGQVLGFVGSQGQGLDGIEAKFNEILSGEKKKLRLQRDARGRPLIQNGRVFSESPDGSSLQLSIDIELQYSLEQELQKTIKDFNAESAVGVILDAQSSEILAMVNAPLFDPNQAFKHDADLRRNRSITDPFEPGSTLKTFTIAAALKEKIAKPNSKYFCEDGKMRIGKRWIREADSRHSHRWLTVSEILAKSSNVGTTKIALELGSEKLYKNLREFGFGEKLQSQLPGESKGILPKPNWNDHLIANISFGHGMAATALQIANAYASIANGGDLKEPQIVKTYWDAESRDLVVNEEKVIRNVLSATEASQLTMMLQNVTSEDGTGQNARVPGFLVAGKTGTAQKIDPVTGTYMPGAYSSSFAGFVPAQDPKFVIYIAVDDPQDVYYGSQVAAPVFSRIASYALLKEGILPVKIENKDLLYNNATTSQKLKLRKNLKIQKKALKEIQKSILDQTDMPSLAGQSLREAIESLSFLPLEIQIQGQGQVRKTWPAAGKKLFANQKVILYLNSKNDNQ